MSSESPLNRVCLSFAINLNGLRHINNYDFFLRRKSKTQVNVNPSVHYHLPNMCLMVVSPRGVQDMREAASEVWHETIFRKSAGTRG